MTSVTRPSVPMRMNAFGAKAGGGAAAAAAVAAPDRSPIRQPSSSPPPALVSTTTKSRRDTVCVVMVRLLSRSEEHTSELQSRLHLVCRLLLEKKQNSDREDLQSLVFT